MSLSLKIKPENAVCTGNIKTLLAPAMEKKTKSIDLIKEIFGIVISAILYYRKIFPDEVFIKKKLGNKIVYIVTNKSGNKFANTLCAIVASIHKPIELGYLRKMTLMIQENEQILEAHSLYLEHSGERYETVMLEQFSGNSQTSKKLQIDNLHDTLIQVLNTFIYTLKAIDLTPQKPGIMFTLEYFKDVTPVGFTPKHFELLDGSKSIHSLALNPINWGSISTPFHSVALKSRYTPAVQEKMIEYFANKENRAPSILSASTVKNGPQPDIQSNNIANLNGEKENPMLCKIVALNARNEDTSLHNDPHGFTDLERAVLGENVEPVDLDAIETEKTSNTQDSCVAIMDSNEECTEIIKIDNYSNTIRCPCNTDIHYGALITCDRCRLQQHIICFDMILPEHCPSMHICELCAKDDPKFECTVPELVKLKNEDKIDRSLFRLTLSLCNDDNFVLTANNLVNTFDLNPEYANSLLDRLVDMKLIYKKGPRYRTNKYIFNKKIVPKYFFNFRKGVKATIDVIECSDSDVLPRKSKRARSISQ